MDRSRIGIIIPALNESATIAHVVKSVASQGIPVVVDDGSTDATGELATAAGATLVRHESCLGYDQALNTGFARASALGCEYLITMDGDGQHDTAVVSAFVRELDAGADAVVGIRDRRQRIAEHFFGWVGAIKWSIRDPLCGMKAYRVAVYRELGYFDSYGSIGTELALFAAKRGKRIAQVAVKTRDRADQPRFGRRYQANMRILRALYVSLSAYR